MLPSDEHLCIKKNPVQTIKKRSFKLNGGGSSNEIFHAVNSKKAALYATKFIMKEHYETHKMYPGGYVKFSLIDCDKGNIYFYKANR